MAFYMESILEWEDHVLDAQVALAAANSMAVKFRADIAILDDLSIVLLQQVKPEQVILEIVRYP